ALARLEGAQLREQILVLLAREPRHLLLAEELRSVALRAIELLRELGPRLGILGARAVPRRRRRLLREVSGELVEVAVGELRRHRRHLRILAIALAEHVERGREELRRLAGERGHRRIGRIAALAVARSAGIRIRGARRRRKEERNGKRR